MPDDSISEELLEAIKKLWVSEPTANKDKVSNGTKTAGREWLAEEARKAEEARCRKLRETLTEMGFADDYTPSLYEYMIRAGEMMEGNDDK